MVETYTLTESWAQIRKKALERDEYECQYCGVEEPVAMLEVHHIIPVRLDGGDELENLVTLCQRCHNSLHKLGEDPEYHVNTLENAEKETNGQQTETNQIDKRYTDDTPKDWSQDEWGKVVSDTDAPAKANLTTKSIDGNDYYYFQWRENGKIKKVNILHR
mgnify:FL=1